MSKHPIENGGPWHVVEMHPASEYMNSAAPYPYEGRECTTKLEAIISALLWKRDTKKDCRVYDAAGIVIYDTALSNESLELTQWAS